MRLNVRLAALLAATALPAQSQNAIPTDAAPTCAVETAEFEADWVDTGHDGGLAVVPPNGFKEFASECDFYKWGAQMFLWLTSPSGPGGDLVFDSPGFFDVAHDAPGTEKVAETAVIENRPGAPSVFALRGAKPEFRGALEQAGGNGVLLSQGGSLTYYGMHVNDAYVAFRLGFLSDPDAFNFTGGGGSDNPFQFPTDIGDVELVVAFGVETGIIRDAGVALTASTVELKTSWVDASTLKTPGDFLTIRAEVPKYAPDPDAPSTRWAPDGTEVLDLAMVGMHIAAPVQGHPELVWISYEHLSNSPIGSYLYAKDGGGTGTYSFDSTGDWTFAASGAPWPDLIAPHVSVDADGMMVAAKGETIAPQDVVLFNPWGLAASTNSDMTGNTDLVSLNASLIGLLGDRQDVRASYFQIGGVWTTGALPTYQDYGVQRGGLMLANSTMESFHQFGAQLAEGDTAFVPYNCFDCHSVSGTEGDPGNFGVAVSHIFQGINRLGDATE